MGFPLKTRDGVYTESNSIVTRAELDVEARSQLKSLCSADRVPSVSIRTRHRFAINEDSIADYLDSLFVATK